MQRWIRGVGLVALGWTVARADTVTLKSGAVIAGEIVGEDAYEVRIVVSRTATGDIQTLKIINQATVAGLQRDAPNVALEADPIAAEAQTNAGRATAAMALTDIGAIREAVKRADRQTGDGLFDEAAQLYRSVADETEHRLDALRGGDATGEDRGAQRDLLQIRQDACDHLLIALQGKLDGQRERLRAGEASARELERRIALQRDEVEALERDVRDADGHNVRRLGQQTSTVTTDTRLREMEGRIKTGEARLAALREEGREARLTTVSLESEIEIAKAKAEQAQDENAAVVRASRVTGR